MKEIISNEKIEINIHFAKGTIWNPLKLHNQKKSEITAVIILIGILGLFWKLAGLILVLFDIESGIWISNIGQIIRLIFIISFIIINWKDREELYIKKGLNFFKLSKSELRVLIIGIIVLIMFSIIYSYVQLGGIFPMVLKEYPSTIMAALFYGIVEELEFRSVFLIYFTKWFSKLNLFQQKNNYKKLMVLVVTVDTLFFGPLYHNRYINSDWIMLSVVTLFGLFACLATLKYKSINLAWMLHFLLDFIPFIFIAGALHSL
ncbi:MAG: CPBP family intramembrane glutamic endopeptidase [Promethearchaeota archaeon]